MNELFINGRFLTQKITGVQRYGIEITKRLKHLIPCTVLTPPNIIHQSLAKDLNAKIVGRFSSHLWEQVELPLFLKSEGSPLLFNFNGLGPILYSNKIITIHDISFIVNPKWFSWSYSTFYKLFTSLSAQYCRKLITVSEFSKNEIIKHLKLSSKNIEIIYNAVDWSKTKRSAESLIDGDYILTVSSLDPRKNLHTLISAFRLLNKENIKLVIVGSANRIFNTSDGDRNEKDVVYFGHAKDDELYNLYKHAKAFVFPSYYEGFGIPPLEAMSLGIPVIASNSSSLPEICGNAAKYFEPNSAEELAKLLNLVLEDASIREELINNGYENIKRFSWEKSANRLAVVIRSYIRK